MKLVMACSFCVRLGWECGIALPINLAVTDPFKSSTRFCMSLFHPSLECRQERGDDDCDQLPTLRIWKVFLSLPKLGLDAFISVEDGFAAWMKPRAYGESSTQRFGDSTDLTIER